MDPWGRERLDELAALVDTGLPAEQLTPDELLACCWDDPGVVLAPATGDGVIAAGMGTVGDELAAFVKLVCVPPSARRQGRGTALLAAVEEWAWDQGATEVRLAASPPAFLWPGVDVHHTAMQCLAERAGYWAFDAAFDMSVPATFRASTPAGAVVRRAVDDADVAGVEAMVAEHWPEWSAETHRAVEQGTCLGAFSTDDPAAPLAFACHSVNRTGWFGPTGTIATARHRGIGLALLGEVCRDLRVAGFADVEICWIGPVGFYAAAGGALSRCYRLYRRPKR